MRRAVIRSSSLALAAALSLGGGLGCSTTSGPGGRMTAAAADVLVPVEQENQLGQQMAAEIQAEMTMHPDPEVQAYVANIGNRLVAAAQADVPSGITFRFHVVQDDATVNAFAIPGGDIYFYTGPMRLAENEAELAGVLGHEVAHVTNRHIAQRLVAQYGLQSIIAMALGQAQRRRSHADDPGHPPAGGRAARERPEAHRRAGPGPRRPRRRPLRAGPAQARRTGGRREVGSAYLAARLFAS